MPVFELEESEWAGPIEDDTVFEAEVISVKQVVAPFKDKETGADIHQMEWKFTVVEEGSKWDGTPLYGKTGVKFNTHPDCKFKNWVVAVLAAEIDKGFRLDTDTLPGNRCRIVVSAEPYVDKKGEEKVANRVKDVMPSRDADMPGGEEVF